MSGHLVYMNTKNVNISKLTSNAKNRTKTAVKIYKSNVLYANCAYKCRTMPFIITKNCAAAVLN